MNTTIRYCILLAAVWLLAAFSPPRNGAGNVAVSPVLKDAVTHENQFLLAFSIQEKAVTEVIVYEPWDTSLVEPMASKSDRGSVVDALERLTPPGFVTGRLSCIEYPFHQKPETTETQMGFTDRRTATEILHKDTASAAMRSILNVESPYARIGISGWVPERFNLSGGDNHRCTGNSVATSVRLNPGFNQVYTIYLGPGNSIIGMDSLRVFYATASGQIGIPSGFSVEPFHRSTRESSCKSCHSESATGSGSGSLKCGSCHGGLMAQSNVHGPVAAGDCSTCHYEEPDSGYAVRFTPSDAGQTCLTCHDVIDKELKSKPIIHAPVKKGLCLSCHSPHGSSFAKQLRREVNDQCFSCHAEKRDGDHPVVFHPVGDRPDGHSPGNNLTCLSCHVPHASENIDLLAVSGGYFAVCQTCHQK